MFELKTALWLYTPSFFVYHQTLSRTQLDLNDLNEHLDSVINVIHEKKLKAIFSLRAIRRGLANLSLIDPFGLQPGNGGAGRNPRQRPMGFGAT